MDFDTLISLITEFGTLGTEGINELKEKIHNEDNQTVLTGLEMLASMYDQIEAEGFDDNEED
jgi:hypothetical protein